MLTRCQYFFPNIVAQFRRILVNWRIQHSFFLARFGIASHEEVISMLFERYCLLHASFTFYTLRCFKYRRIIIRDLLHCKTHGTDANGALWITAVIQIIDCVEDCSLAWSCITMTPVEDWISRYWYFMAGLWSALISRNLRRDVDCVLQMTSRFGSTRKTQTARRRGRPSGSLHKLMFITRWDNITLQVDYVWLPSAAEHDKPLDVQGLQ